jgi:hypothetical protein
MYIVGIRLLPIDDKGMKKKSAAMNSHLAKEKPV